MLSKGRIIPFVGDICMLGTNTIDGMICYVSDNVTANCNECLGSNPNPSP